jgi:hypothetical protein
VEGGWRKRGREGESEVGIFFVCVRVCVHDERGAKAWAESVTVDKRKRGAATVWREREKKKVCIGRSNKRKCTSTYAHEWTQRIASASTLLPSPPPPPTNAFPLPKPHPLFLFFFLAAVV